MRVLQITDCHLSGDPDARYRGEDARKNLRITLRKAGVFEPDLLLASGDLSEDGSAASYRELKSCFDAAGVPVLSLPGNHDDPALVAEFFPGSPLHEPALSEHGGWQIIRLNSCLPGRPEGRLGRRTLDGLRRVLAAADGRPKLIALHHQPVPVGSAWIDRYPLLEPEDFLALADACAEVKAVVWGHVHQAFDGRRRGTALLGSPSSVINSVPGACKFTPDTCGPACRWLELLPNGRLRTGIA